MPKNFPLLKSFQFVVVTVNKQGNIINREIKKAEYFTEDLGEGVILDMVAIPGGKFLMGACLNEKDSSNSERPQHEVTIQPFFMSKFPVTQAQWKALTLNAPKANGNLALIERDLKSNPSRFKDDHRPVEQVGWYDAVEFCQRLSKKTGNEYRLPSEAEWEYAIRAGTTTPFYFGSTMTTDLANYKGNETYENELIGEYRKQTTPVGLFPPNAFGLYDLHGQVWEWCADNWHDNYQGAPIDGSAWLKENQKAYRIIRGGAWNLNPSIGRCAFRLSNSPDYDYDPCGFRLVCDFPRTSQDGSPISLLPFALRQKNSNFDFQ